MSALSRAATADVARFEALFTQNFADVLRFVVRRIGPSDAMARAESITQDTFLTAWRRLASVPTEPLGAKAWLYAVARSLMLHEHRGAERRVALEVRLADDALVKANRASQGCDTTTPAPDDLVLSRLDLAAAWVRLKPAEQEVLSLAAWEDLPASQAALVLGISILAYRTRLTRARASLRKLLAENTQP